MNVWSLFGSISLDSSGVTRGLRDTEQAASKSGAAIERDLGQRLERLQRNLNSIGSTFTLLGAPLAAFGATAIRAAGDFESSMNRVQGLTRATGDQFERLSDLARDLGATTAFSASQAADAMGNLATAGFSVEEIYDALPGVLELAAASGLDLADAAGIAAQTLRGFGLEAEEVGRVNDVLARTSSAANTDVRQLGEAFQYVAPIANGLGFSFEETSAAIGLISDAGIQASSAGTGLRSILTQLISESDDLGITTRDTAGNMLPLADILSQLEARGFTAEEAMAAFGETGGPALVALLARGTDALSNLNTELENSAGTAADLADTRMRGFNGAIAQLGSAFEALQIAVAESGLLQFVTDLVNRLAGWLTTMSELNPTVLRIATIISAVVASIGPLLLAAGKAVEVFLALRTGLTAVTTAITVLRTAMLAAAGPAGWIILGVTALAGLTAGFLATRDSAKEVEEQLAPGTIAFERNARAIELVTAETERLTTAATDFITPIRAVSDSVMDSTDSVESLRSKVNEIADTLDGDAKTAFLEYAETAIASGDTLEAVGARIADRAARDSLLSRVSTLAEDINENGRQAFINYALESIATADTAEEALDRVVRAWARAQVAGEEAVLATARSNLETELLTTTSNLNTLIDRRNGLMQQNAINQREVNRLRLRELRDAQDHADTIRLLNSTINTNNDYLAQSAGEVTILSERQATLRSELDANEEATGRLNRTVEGLTRTNQAAVSSGVQPLKEAAEGAAEGVGALADKIVYSLDTIRGLRDRIRELNEEFETTEDAGRRIEIRLAITDLEAQVAALLAEVDAALEEAQEGDDAIDVTISPTVTIDQEALRQLALERERWANARAQQIEREEALELSLRFTTLNSVTERIDAERQAAQDREQWANARQQQYEREEADELELRFTTLNSVNERIEADQRLRAEQTRLANERALLIEQEELREREAAIAGVNAVNDRIAAEQALADAFAEAARANLGYQDGLVGTAANATDFAETQVRVVDALVAVGEATDDQVITSLRGLEAALVQQRQTLDPYSEEFAILTERLAKVRERLDGYAQAARSASAAEADANRSAAEAARIAATADVDLALRKRDLNMLTTEQAITIVNTLIAALMLEIATTDSATAAYVDLNEQLQRALELKAQLEGGSFEFKINSNLNSAFDALQTGLNSIASSLPVLGQGIEALSDAIGGSFNPWNILVGILTDVIGSSAAVQTMFQNIVAAMQPFIDTIGTALVNALTPLLTVAVQLMNALSPIIEVAIALVQTALMPLVWILQNIFTPVITFVANVIRAIWNGIATALNAILGIFGVRIPTIGAPGEGAAPGAPGGGAGGGGAREEPPMEGEILRSNGVIIRRDQDGNIRVAYGTNAAPAGSIQRERDTIGALNQALSLSTDAKERTQIRGLIQKHQQILEAKEGDPSGLPKEPPPPPPPAEPERTPGLIEQLEAERRAWQKKLSEATTEAEIEEANQNLARIDAEISRLRAIGQPVAPTDPTEPKEPTPPTQPVPPTRSPRAPRRPTTPTPTTPTTPTTPPVTPPTPTPERPIVFDEQQLNFATVTQSVQFAVATPIVEASIRMLDAARTLAGIGGETGMFASIPPFTAAIERLTPLLDRLILEGVSINVNSASGTTGFSFANALRPL